MIDYDYEEYEIPCKFCSAPCMEVHCDECEERLEAVHFLAQSAAGRLEIRRVLKKNDPCKKCF